MDFRQLHQQQPALSQTGGEVFCGKAMSVHNREGAEFLGGEGYWGSPALFFLHGERFWPIGYFSASSCAGIREGMT